MEDEPVEQPSHPRLDPRWFASICQLGPRPLVVTGWFRIWLAAHFSSAQLIEDQESTALTTDLWTPDNKTTKILIESVTKWVPELTEMRPGIVIKRNKWTRVRKGINDQHMFTSAPDQQERYSNYWQGSHTLFCISGEGAETEKLAAEVFRELNQFGPRIRRILGLERFEVMEVSDILKVKTDARENFAVAITVGYVYAETWTIYEESPLLKTLLLRVDLADFQP